MQEININVEILEDKISQLSALHKACATIPFKTKDMKGSGESVSAIHEVEQEYDALKTCFEQLLSNTIQFFENVKQSVVGADEGISAGLKAEQHIIRPVQKQ